MHPSLCMSYRLLHNAVEERRAHGAETAPKDGSRVGRIAIPRTRTMRHTSAPFLAPSMRGYCAPCRDPFVHSVVMGDEYTSQWPRDPLDRNVRVQCLLDALFHRYVAPIGMRCRWLGAPVRLHFEPRYVTTWVGFVCKPAGGPQRHPWRRRNVGMGSLAHLSSMASLTKNRKSG